MLARKKSLIRPGPIERRQQLVLCHDGPARRAAVELLDGLVQSGAVHDGVVRRNRHAENVHVLVLERASQVIVHLVETERKRPLAWLAPGFDRFGHRLKRSQPFERRVGRSVGSGTGGRRCGQVERFQHELRHTAGPPPTVVGGVREHQLITSPGHTDIEQPTFFLEVSVTLWQDFLY